MQESTRNDSELVQRALEGNLEAFDTIVRRYQDAVYATALYRTGNFADAQDIAQEAFLAAYVNLSKLRDPSKLASWLRTITLYTYNHWQRKHRDMEMLDAHNGSSDAIVSHRPSRPDEIVERQELRQQVLSAIASLPKHTGEVVTLYYIDGFSYQDIAEFLSLSTTTVKGRLQMGRKRLREELVGMMEETLKQNRPDSRFSESVLEEIVQRAGQARKDNAHDELLQACDEALELMPHVEDTETKKRMGMDILRWRADALFDWLGKPEEAAASWEEAAQLAGELGKKDEQARWLLMVGISHWHDGQHAVMKPYAQQARAIYQELDDLHNRALCDAVIDLCELLPAGWERTENPDRDLYTGYAVAVFPLIRSDHALIWDWKERQSAPHPTHHLISAKLRRSLPAGDTTFGRIARPAKWMELPPNIGQTWDDEIATRDGEVLPVHTTVASLADTVVAPAGKFENCLRLESRIIEPENADMSQQMKVFRRREHTGLRILWFAPGVGLVKAHHENENSKYALYQLTEYDIVEETNDYFPIHPRNCWSYQWYVDWCKLLFTERCRVADGQEDTWYLTSASYSDPLDAKAQREYFERLRQLEHDSGNLRGEIWTLNALHNIHARLGDMDRAARLWEKQDSLCARLEDEKLHYALLMRTDYEHHPYIRIQAWYEQAAAIARTLGDPRRELTPWCYLADAALRRKDYACAADAAQKAVAILEEVDEGEELAGMVATLDLSRTLLHAPDADQNVGFWRLVLYQEGEELLLSGLGGVGSGGFESGVDPTCEYRINPPSFGFLLDAPLLKEPYEVGVSWSDHSGERTVKQRITATDATVEVPAGVFERCLLIEVQIRCHVERKGSPDADALSEAMRGFTEGTLLVWFAQGHGIVQMDYHHRNGQRTLVQLTGDEIQASDASYLPLKPGNVWYYDWTNERGEMLIHEMYRVLPKRGERTYIAVSAYAAHSDYAG